ncbi:MAG: tetratricopeptide repeat protein [Planctomycetes bacterium]|nr:tetratricopeptide repeat protein [Planctomycetota bacterium]
MAHAKIDEALELFYQGETSGAEVILQEVGGGKLEPPADLHPLDAAAFWEGVGGIALAREKAQDAVNAFRKMIELEEKGGADANGHATSYAKLGEALARTDKLDYAIEAFNTAASKKEACGAPPESQFNVTYRYAECMFRSGRPKEAGDQFAKAVKLAEQVGVDDATMSTLTLYLADSIKQKIAPMQASVKVQKGMQGASAPPQIAILEKQLEGEFQQIAELYRKAGDLAEKAKMPADYKLQIQRNMAEAYHDAGRFVKGVMQRKKLIQQAEANKVAPLEIAYMLHGLAESHKEMGQMPEAVEAYRKSIRLKEQQNADKVSQGKSWYALGEVLAGGEKWDQAIEALTKARELEEASAATDENHKLRLKKAWHTLGLVLEAAGKKEEGKAAQEKAESI